MIKLSLDFSVSRYLRSNKGFTLVELLVVISLVGILAGVMISIINPVKQRKIAEDGVKMANLQKYALGIEAYGNANSFYPDEMEYGEDNVPLVPEIRSFIAQVPNDEPPGAFYSYNIDSSDDSFTITVTKTVDPSYCFKYRSTWGKIKSCPIGHCDIGDYADCI